MPTLPLEKDCYPENLFSARSEDGGCWTVLHTRPRQEKSVGRQLSSARLHFYLPLAGKRSVLRGKVNTAYHPLFPGYVFLRATPEDRLKALGLTTGRIVRTLPVPDQESLWRDLVQIHRLTNATVDLVVETCLEPGDLVEIKEGALAGLQGRIVRRASRRRFVVVVDFLHQGASVCLDDGYLAPLPEGPSVNLKSLV